MTNTCPHNIRPSSRCPECRRAWNRKAYWNHAEKSRQRERDRYHERKKAEPGFMENRKQYVKKYRKKRFAEALNMFVELAGVGHGK